MKEKKKRTVFYDISLAMMDIIEDAWWYHGRPKLVDVDDDRWTLPATISFVPSLLFDSDQV